MLRVLFAPWFLRYCFILDPCRVESPPALGCIIRCLEYDTHALAQEFFAKTIMYDIFPVCFGQEGDLRETVIPSDESLACIWHGEPETPRHRPRVVAGETLEPAR